MASLRPRTRVNGTEYFAVLYRANGKQTSTSFDDFDAASKFAKLVDKFGPENALGTLEADTTLTTLTVQQWCQHHVDLLTGVDENTRAKYRAILRKDVAPTLGDLPLAGLTHDHVARWVNGMRELDEDGSRVSEKTIKNRHGFLAGCLNSAIPKHITANPCSATKWPQAEEREMTFLNREQFALLYGKITEFWQPMVRFLLVSGARWGEVAALKPGDVNVAEGTVRISRTWKYGVGGYTLGPLKTKKSRRTINVPKTVLKELNLSHEFVFVNRDGGPVRSHGFIRRVWAPAVERAWPSTDENGKAITSALKPRVHDLRHSCASWMIQDNVPLPVIQQHLGHEDIQTTVKIYGHLDRTSMQAASDAMAAALSLQEPLKAF